MPSSPGAVSSSLAMWAAQWYAPVRIVGVSKNTYVLATSRRLEWRCDLHRTSTGSGRTRSTILIGMAAVMAAIIGALGNQSLASSSAASH